MQVVGPEVANYFSAHPDVAEAVGGPLDFTPATQVIHIYGEHGGFTFDPSGPGEFEVHAMFTKAGRGKWALEAAQETLRMIAALGATRLWARVKTPELAFYTRRAGFREIDAKIMEPGPAWHRIFEWRPVCPQQ